MRDVLADLSLPEASYPSPDSSELPELSAELQAVLEVLAQVTEVHHHLLWKPRIGRVAL